VPNNKYSQNNDKSKDYYFDGEAVIAFRNNNSPWKIYALDLFNPSNWSTYAKVKDQFKNYFFHDIKDKSEYVLDSTGAAKLQKYKFSIDEPLFWSQSLIWQKGLKMPDLYNFQTTGSVHAPKRLKEIKVDYPDSLVKLYKAQ
jgi:hypothetical protein